jgi:hypothetical protein
MAQWVSYLRAQGFTVRIPAKPNPPARPVRQANLKGNPKEKPKEKPTANQTRRRRQRKMLQEHHLVRQLRRLLRLLRKGHPLRRSHPPLGRLRLSPQAQVGQTNRKKNCRRLGTLSGFIGKSKSLYLASWPKCPLKQVQLRMTRRGKR